MRVKALAPLLLCNLAAAFNPSGAGARFLVNKPTPANPCQRNGLHHCCSVMVDMDALMQSSTPRPALRLGGEWAGHCVAFSHKTGTVQPVPERYLSEEMVEWNQVPAGFEELTTETWLDNGTMSRRTIRLLPEDGCNTEDLSAEVSRAELPPACSGLTVLRPDASMMEPDVLNVHAWALDAVEDSNPCMWRLESIFNGIGGDRPMERGGAMPCPAERTRVVFTFNKTAGKLATSTPVLVWQERCWSASPSDKLLVRETGGGRSGLDAAWVSSLVGLKCFGEQESKKVRDAQTSNLEGTLCLTVGGVELCAEPGSIKITLTSGKDSKNRWRQAVLHRRWVDGSLNTDVNMVDATEVEDDD